MFLDRGKGTGASVQGGIAEETEPNARGAEEGQCASTHRSRRCRRAACHGGIHLLQDEGVRKDVLGSVPRTDT